MTSIDVKVQTGFEELEGGRGCINFVGLFKEKVVVVAVVRF